MSQPTIEVKQNHRIEIGLKMIGQENMTQVDHFKKMGRFELASLKNQGIGRLCCARCRHELLDGLDQLSMKWFALPSEDWEEFVEYWVCHEDMKIKSGDDGSGGNGLRKPKNNEGFLGDWFLELDLDWIDQITSSDENICQTIGWRSQTRENLTARLSKKHFVECKDGFDFINVPLFRPVINNQITPTRGSRMMMIALLKLH